MHISPGVTSRARGGKLTTTKYEIAFAVASIIAVSAVNVLRCTRNPPPK